MSKRSIKDNIKWKLRKSFRLSKVNIRWILRYHKSDNLFRKTMRSLKRYGIRTTWQRIRQKTGNLTAAEELNKHELFSEEELEAQRKYQFSEKIRFSIVTPLYNTSEVFLRAMIESVLSQTYGNFQLCMADGSDADHTYVEMICREYEKKDSRIRYKKLEKNLGISGNTNECLKMATGDYIGLLDHDDLLHPAALFEVMRAILKTGADFIYTDENTFHNTPKDAYCPHFKPDFAPDTLCGNNYICHFTVFKRDLLDKVGKFDESCDGSQDHDMVFRLTEQAKRVAHIPEILYYWRAHPNSVAESTGVKPYAINAGIKAVERHLQRMGRKGEVSTVGEGLAIYRIRYAISGMPKISILIPNKDHYEDLKKCLTSVFEKTTYSNYEIIIIENNSTSKKIFDYYEQIQKEHENVRVITWKHSFNYSMINNFGAEECDGEYILLLNNDTEIITPDWIQEMLMFAQRSDVGAVGAKLYYPNNTIQHAGVGIGLLRIAGHYFRGVNRYHTGYMGRLLYVQNVSAVTAACVMISRDVFHKMGGFDENFVVAFNDIDLCMRIRRAGYLVVWTPFAELYHYESISRGANDTLEKQKRHELEVTLFEQRWKNELMAGDPYYNPNFSLDREDFFINPFVKQYKAR